MKANELRIGNLVQADGGNVNEVVEIRLDTLRCKYIRQDTNEPHVSIIYNVNLFGIPITEEWLVQAGFVFEYGLFVFKTSNYETIKITLNKAIFHFENVHEFYYNKGNRDSVHRNIQFVHQLQNLYFALTGLELTFNQKI